MCDFNMTTVRTVDIASDVEGSAVLTVRAPLAAPLFGADGTRRSEYSSCGRLESNAKHFKERSSMVRVNRRATISWKISAQSGEEGGP